MFSFCIIFFICFSLLNLFEACAFKGLCKKYGLPGDKLWNGNILDSLFGGILLKYLASISCVRKKLDPNYGWKSGLERVAWILSVECAYCILLSKERVECIHWLHFPPVLTNEAYIITLRELTLVVICAFVCFMETNV